MQDRQPTYPGRVKLKDVETGAERVYDMTMADMPIVPGTPPTKANLLTDQTAECLGLGEDATVDKALKALFGINWRLIKIIDNKDGYSGSWEAPDVFGDGQPYMLGAYLIGGGGAGGAGYDHDISYTSDQCSYGGCAGMGKNVIFPSVSPQATYQFVVGKGGVAQPLSYNATGSSSKRGDGGGSTSFGGKVAEGGSGGGFELMPNNNHTFGGGQASCHLGRDYNDLYENFGDVYGCIGAVNEYLFTQSPRIGQNQFDTTMVSLCAGGSVRCFDRIAQTINPMPDGTKGGNGAAGTSTLAAESATGYGNGGGGAFVEQSASGRVTAGSGSDGAIYLYAARRESA